MHSCSLCERGEIVHVDFDANDLPAAKGGWVELRGSFTGKKRAYTLEELLTCDPKTGRPALRLFQWKDG